MKKILSILFVLGLLLVTAGCGGKTEAPPDETAVSGESNTDDAIEDVDISNSGQKIEITTEDGNKATLTTDEEGTELPDGYPTDILPVFPDGKIVFTMTNGEKNYSVQQITETGIKEIYTFYLDTLKDASDVVKMESSEGFSIMCRKNGYVINVVCTKTEEDDKDLSALVLNIQPQE